MAALNPPPLFKKIVPYLKRAEELDKDTAHPESKVVAYYCRAYAMTVAMDVRGADNSKEVMTFLMTFMDKLESEKKFLTPESVQPAEGQRMVREFADKVFTKADEEDQLGVSDKNTARTFYAAGNFYDILEQFPAKDPEAEKRRKFAKWRANEILVAIKEGRAPTPAPGGFNGAATDGGEAAAGGSLSSPPPPSTGAQPLSPPSTASPSGIPQAPSGTPSYPPMSPPKSATDVPPPGPGFSAPPPAYTSIVSPTSNPMGGGSVAPAPAPPQPQPSVAKPPVPTPAYKPASLPRIGSGGLSPAISDAKEYTYAAISAMNIKDSNKAIELLEKAIATLRKS